MRVLHKEDVFEFNRAGIGGGGRGLSLNRGVAAEVRKNYGCTDGDCGDGDCGASQDAR
jgi:hypothetical protein